MQVIYNGAVTAQHPPSTWQGKCVRCRPEVTHCGDMPPSRAVVGSAAAASAEQAGPGRWGAYSTWKKWTEPAKPHKCP